MPQPSSSCFLSFFLSFFLAFFLFYFPFHVQLLRRMMVLYLLPSRREAFGPGPIATLISQPPFEPPVNASPTDTNDGFAIKRKPVKRRTLEAAEEENGSLLFLASSRGPRVDMSSTCRPRKAIDFFGYLHICPV